MPHAARWGLLGVAVSAVTLGSLAPAAALAPGQGGRAPAQGARMPVAGTRPGWALPSREVRQGLRVGGTVVVRVYLASRAPRQLATFATAVSTPGKAEYGHYLTAAQARSRFGPAPDAVRVIRSWLTAAGMTVSAVRTGRVAGGYVAARGTAAAAGRAFAVGFARYRAPDGHIYRAPTREPKVPAAAASAVLAVGGLDTAPDPIEPWARVSAPRARATRPRGPADPCSHYFGEVMASGKPTAYGRHWPWSICGYTPRQLRGAYNVTASGMTGAGQTVAIVLPYQSPTLLADANRYARDTGDRPFAHGQYQRYQVGRFTHQAECGGVGPIYGEQDLDVEAVHGLAPGARVRYVASASCEPADMADALAFVVNRHLASIVTNSWSWLMEEARLLPVYNTIFQAGAAEGIGFFFSSGDFGYNAPAQNPESKRIQVEFPPASPWVTAVGGTSLAIGKTDRYLWETSWGNLSDPLAADGRSWRYPPPGRYPAGFGGAGGGGVSTRYGQPFYQRGVVPLRLATRLPDGRRSRRPMRVVPDVAAVGNWFTGMLVGARSLQTGRYEEHPGGGTSLSSPVFAGIQADAQQAAGRVFGFANPLLYSMYGTSAFHDVTDHPLGPVYPSVVTETDAGGRRSVSLVAVGINGRGRAALRAVRGYDAATGVGSPWFYIQSPGRITGGWGG